jgi:HK97 family phage prohead protease
MFVKGCFADSLKDIKANRGQIPLKDSHGRTVGIFPAETLLEDEKGLYGEGEINLEVEQGRDCYSLVKQKAYPAFSIGYRAEKSTFENAVRMIQVASIWEGSPTDIPMNPAAIITEVKSVNSKESFPSVFGDKDVKWDAVAAEMRIREKTGAIDAPNDEYAKCFILVDTEQKDSFSGYKNLVCDVVDGEIKTMPRAVVSVRASIDATDAIYSFSDTAIKSLKELINNLYTGMALDMPYDAEGKASPYCLTEVKCLTKSMMSHLLRTGLLSKNAADYIAGIITTKSDEFKADESGSEEIKTALNGFISKLEITHRSVQS